MLKIICFLNTYIKLVSMRHILKIDIFKNIKKTIFWAVKTTLSYKKIKNKIFSFKNNFFSVTQEDKALWCSKKTNMFLVFQKNNYFYFIFIFYSLSYKKKKFKGKKKDVLSGRRYWDLFYYFFFPPYNSFLTVVWWRGYRG